MYLSTEKGLSKRLSRHCTCSDPGVYNDCLILYRFRPSFKMTTSICTEQGGSIKTIATGGSLKPLSPHMYRSRRVGLQQIDFHSMYRLYRPGCFLKRLSQHTDLGGPLKRLPKHVPIQEGPTSDFNSIYQSTCRSVPHKTIDIEYVPDPGGSHRPKAIFTACTNLRESLKIIFTVCTDQGGPTKPLPQHVPIQECPNGLSIQ